MATRGLAASGHVQDASKDNGPGTQEQRMMNSTPTRPIRRHLQGSSALSGSVGGSPPPIPPLQGLPTRRNGWCMRLPDLSLVLFGLAAGLPSVVDAQDSLQANNPIAGAISFNFQNEFIGNLSSIDESANILNFRSVIPFQFLGGDWIARATVPLATLPTVQSTSPLSFNHVTGLGDINVFAIKLLDLGNPTVSFGVGPSLTLPTATDDALGGGTWNAGLANVLFNFSNPQFQWGYLLVWETDVAKDRSSAADVNRAFFQPFGIRQLGDGWYLRSTGVWNYDFETDSYAVPIGFGFGRVIPTERTIVNAFFEPQYSVLTDGPGQREWGLFFGVNFQLR